jgi:nucleotide-binding universal stress UspA family protein
MSGASGKVVVGYDREAGGREALALGCDLAREHDCDLLAVNVRRRVPGLMRPPVVDFMVAVEVAEQVRALDETVEVKTRLVEASDPADALGEAAARESAAVLVVGSSRQREHRLHPRGVTRRVVDGVSCPVAIAPPGFRHRDEPWDHQAIDELVVARPERRGSEWDATDETPAISAGVTFPA